MTSVSHIITPAKQSRVKAISVPLLFSIIGTTIKIVFLTLHLTVTQHAPAARGEFVCTT